MPGASLFGSVLRCFVGLASPELLLLSKMTSATVSESCLHESHIFNPPKNDGTVMNTFSGSLDRMFCCVLRLEAFVLLSRAQWSGEEIWEVQSPHLFLSRAVVVNLGTHDGHNLIGSAGRTRRKTWRSIKIRRRATSSARADLQLLRAVQTERSK